MNAFCPNLSNPQIKQEFAELVQAVGEDAAYYFWNANNGYSLESAPNGAPSKLFNDLLDYYNGDRQKALETKAKTYTDEFKAWFGDWQSEDKTNVSKVVDENGEPLIVYHHTEAEFDEFDYKFFGQTDPGDKGRGFYFSYETNDHYTNRYGNIILPVFLSLKNPYRYKGLDDYGKLRNFNRSYNPTKKEYFDDEIQKLESEKQYYEEKLKTPEDYENDERIKKLYQNRIDGFQRDINRYRDQLNDLSETEASQKMFDTYDEYDGIVDDSEAKYELVA